MESHAPKHAPKPPLYTGAVRNDDPELSVAHLTRYDSPQGSVKIESHAGLVPGIAEALAEATELMTGLLNPELSTDEDELASKELLPDRVDEVDEGEDEDEAVAEEVTGEVALADMDVRGRLVELREAVEDTDERLVDVVADAEVEVTEDVTEPEVEAVSSSVMVGVGVSSPSVMVISLSSPTDVETGVSSSSEDAELEPVIGVTLADGMPMTMEVMLLELGLATADDDIDEDDCVVIAVVVGPMDLLLPGMRLR